MSSEKLTREQLLESAVKDLIRALAWAESIMINHDISYDARGCAIIKNAAQKALEETDGR